MKTYALCPISEKKVNERVARVNATFTVLLITGFLFTQNIFTDSRPGEVQPGCHIF
jgi:hypothetical protein